MVRGGRSAKRSGGPITPARSVAFDVLESVAAGAYASDSLAELSKRLDSRDAGLAAQIVFGCLRFQAQLDYLISLYSGRRASDLDPPVLTALRAAIFQIRYLDRIPPHAAVNDAVELLKKRKPAASGLANAVLRKVNREPVEWPDLATELSCPAWLLERWTKHYGGDQARGIGLAALREPVPYIRIAPGSPIPEGVEVKPTQAAGCFELLSRPLPGMRLQDIGSQSIVPLLELQPGHTYLDLCAAPGNKTLQAMETPPLLAVACDVSERRARDIPPVCPRVVLDAAEPLPFSLKFDRIFIDAPCSGTGTFARNPEAKWRVQNRDFTRFGNKQAQILENAVAHLASGGKILYATCSLEREENEAVVQQVLEKFPALHLERESMRVPGHDEGDGFYAAVLR